VTLQRCHNVHRTPKLKEWILDCVLLSSLSNHTDATKRQLIYFAPARSKSSINHMPTNTILEQKSIYGKKRITFGHHLTFLLNKIF